MINPYSYDQRSGPASREPAGPVAGRLDLRLRYSVAAEASVGENMSVRRNEISKAQTSVLARTPLGFCIVILSAGSNNARAWENLGCATSPRLERTLSLPLP